MLGLIQAIIRPAYLILSTLVVSLIGSLIALVGLQVAYADRVFPGVRFQGVDLSGKRAEEVFQLAQAAAASLRAPLVTLRMSDRSVTLRASDLGLNIDPAATTERAMRIGRADDLAERVLTQIQTWWAGAEIAPVALMDEGVLNRVLSQLAEEAEVGPRDAGVSFEGGVVREIPAQTGLALDTNRASRLIRVALAAGKPLDLALPTIPVMPRVLSAANAASIAAQAASADLVVMAPRWNDRGEPIEPVEAFRILRADIPNYLIFEEISATLGTTLSLTQTELSVTLNRARLRPMIEPLAAAVNETPENARFVFDDATRALKPLSRGRDQRILNVEATLDAIAAALRSNELEHRVMLVVNATPPPIPATATAQDLGITELITQATTFFKGSSSARLANIRVAAARFHGVVVPPQSTFSFNRFLGAVSADEGFEEGLIIVGDRTIKGVGGGVCQVSTTAYQAALRAGFPIVERYPHGYRVSYYERGMGPGFDAAVFSPLVDMKFFNDTDAHLLIETYFDQARATLTFKFYGRRDGREVSFSEPVIENVVPHGPDIYEPDPEGKLGEGKVRQVEYAVDGATITVRRTVTRAGQTLINERIVSKYQPWQAMYQFGPGFTPPEGAIVRTKP